MRKSVVVASFTFALVIAFPAHLLRADSCEVCRFNADTGSNNCQSLRDQAGWRTGKTECIDSRIGFGCYYPTTAKRCELAGGGGERCGNPRGTACEEFEDLQKDWW